jgi:flagellar biogenesis protein FliO
MIDAADYLRFAFALVFVLALIGLASWFVRRFGLGGRIAGVRAGARRIGIVEATAIDAKRRLVLVRRDEVEHLLLIGGGADLVVEPGIPAGRAPALRPSVPAVGERP